MSTQVLYNNAEISPTPFVSRSSKGLDYGARWGYEETITLNGRKVVNGEYELVISGLLDSFRGQFVPFEIKDAGESLLKYDYSILEDFSISSDKFYSGTYINYTARLRGINVPSGVIEPSNEYSFSQNPDGTVDVSHKISAKGIQTNQNALINAKDFVQAFTGVSNFSSAFVSAGAPVLLSKSETINRLEAVYTIEEKYKYTSGEYLSYCYLHSLSIDESKENNYKKLSLSIDLIGSSINGNISALRVEAAAINPLLWISTKYGINTAKCILESFSISESSGQNTIKISSDFFSGIGDEYVGFFDYDVTLNWDKIANVRSYSINGNYTSTAPINLRNSYINNFLSSIASNGGPTGYLYAITQNSVLANGSFNNSHSINPIPRSFSLTQNTGLGTLDLSASFSDADYVAGSADSNFRVSVDLPIHIFEFKPSANIEGVYIIQDINTESRERVNLSVDIRSEKDKVPELLNKGISILGNLKSSTTNSPLNISSGVNTGVFDVKCEGSFWNSKSKTPQIKTNICYSSQIASIRPGGYKFGR